MVQGTEGTDGTEGTSNTSFFPGRGFTKLNISWTFWLQWSRVESGDKSVNGLIRCQGRCEAELLDNLCV